MYAIAPQKWLNFGFLEIDGFQPLLGIGSRMLSEVIFF